MSFKTLMFLKIVGHLFCKMLILSLSDYFFMINSDDAVIGKNTREMMMRPSQGFLSGGI